MVEKKDFYVPLRLEPKLVDFIDKRVEKIGSGSTRSGWIREAIIKQLKQEMGLRFLWE